MRIEIAPAVKCILSRILPPVTFVCKKGLNGVLGRLDALAERPRPTTRAY